MIILEDQIKELTRRIKNLTGLTVQEMDRLERDVKLIRDRHARGGTEEAVRRADTLAGQLDDLEDRQRHQHMRANPLTRKAWAWAERLEQQAEFPLSALCWHFECGKYYPKTWAKLTKARNLIETAKNRLTGLELGTAEDLLDQAEAILKALPLALTA